MGEYDPGYDPMESQPIDSSASLRAELMICRKRIAELEAKLAEAPETPEDCRNNHPVCDRCAKGDYHLCRYVISSAASAKIDEQQAEIERLKGLKQTTGQR